MNQQLIDYIKNGEAQGYSTQQLRDHLIQQGYDAGEVDESINYAHQGDNSMQQRGNMQAGSGNLGIKKRNVFLVILFIIITFGIYGIFWLVFTTNELRKNTKSAPNPHLLWLMLIPLVNIIVILIYYWKYSKAINELTGFSNIGLFLLWAFLGPVGVIVSQVQLNKKAM